MNKMDIGKLTKTQIENNMMISFSHWNKELKEKLTSIKSSLYLVSQTPKISKDLKFDEKQFNQESIENLKEKNDNYLMNISNIEKLYGLEFPELQKQYEAMLPEINEYLGVKVE